MNNEHLRQLAVCVNNLGFILHNASSDEEIHRITAGVVGTTQQIVMQLSDGPKLYAVDGSVIGSAEPTGDSNG